MTTTQPETAKVAPGATEKTDGRAAKLTKYLIGNIKALRPTDLFTKVDYGWVQHASEDLASSLGVAVDQKVSKKKIKKSGEQAAKATEADLAKHPESYTYGGLRLQLDAFRREWEIETKSYNQLRSTLVTLQGLEIMRMTTTGQRAMSPALTVLDSLLKVIKAEPTRWHTVDAPIRTGGPENENKPVDLDTAIAFKRYLGESIVRAETMIQWLEKVENDCERALTFETIKAYVIKNPDEAHQQLELDLVVVEQSYDAAASVVDLAGQAAQVSGAAQNSISAVKAVADAGLAFVKRAVVAASNERQVKAILAKSKEEKEAAMAEIVQNFDKDEFAVAEMLADKYVRQIQFNLDMIEPLACASLMGIGVGLDTVGAGAATKAGDIIWGLLKTTVIETATEFQQERLVLAKALKAKEKGQYVEAADNYWKKWSSGLMDSVAGKFKTRLVSSTLNLPQTLADSLYGSTIRVLVKEALQHVQLDPAQSFSGQDFLRHISSLQNNRLRAQQAVDAPKVAAQN
ncbi:hypothetical protein AB0P21_17755 [Kribbella sp. NPDC056861]|uniref:hypothetical protein n=1 Tax=Kribbella sp. NPDC056861 TaxID=3154857 RepID=UPI003420388D